MSQPKKEWDIMGGRNHLQHTGEEQGKTSKPSAESNGTRCEGANQIQRKRGKQMKDRERDIPS